MFILNAMNQIVELFHYNMLNRHELNIRSLHKNSIFEEILEENLLKVIILSLCSRTSHFHLFWQFVLRSIFNMQDPKEMHFRNAS